MSLLSGQFKKYGAFLLYLHVNILFLCHNKDFYLLPYFWWNLGLTNATSFATVSTNKRVPYQQNVFSLWSGHEGNGQEKNSNCIKNLSTFKIRDNTQRLSYIKGILWWKNIPQKRHILKRYPIVKCEFVAYGERKSVSIIYTSYEITTQTQISICRQPVVVDGRRIYYYHLYEYTYTHVTLLNIL